MKKLKKINLHHLCKTKMTNYEQNVLRGGAVYCVSICLDAVCACNEVGDESGNFPASDTAASNNSVSTTNERSVSIIVRDA